MTILNELEALERKFIAREKEIERLKNLIDNSDLTVIDLSDTLYNTDIVQGDKETKKVKKVRKAIANKLLTKNSDNLNRTLLKKTKKDTAILVVGIDHSGSMGRFEKFMGECINFWLNAVLEERYNNVEVRYVIHTTESHETDETTAFKDGMSGGTIVSSCFKEMSMIAEEYSYELEENDLFCLYITDGDNLTADNKKAESILINRILTKYDEMFAIKVNQYYRDCTIDQVFDKAKEKKNFKEYELGEKEHLKPILKHIADKIK